MVNGVVRVEVLALRSFFEIGFASTGVLLKADRLEVTAATKRLGLVRLFSTPPSGR